MKKKIINAEISAEELKKHLEKVLLSIKRSGAGICLTFKEEN